MNISSEIRNPLWWLIVILFIGVTLCFVFVGWIWGIVSIVIAILVLGVYPILADKLENRKLLKNPGVAEYIERIASGSPAHPRMERSLGENTYRTKKNLNSKQVYHLEVNYNITIEEYVKLGKFQWVNENWHNMTFKSDNYPSERKGTESIKIQLLPFKGISYKDALDHLNREKYRPAILCELLAFGQQYPEIQMSHIIVAPGTQKQRGIIKGIFNGHGQPVVDSTVYIPCLSSGGLGRNLDLQGISHNANGFEWMFAAVLV